MLRSDMITSLHKINSMLLSIDFGAIMHSATSTENKDVKWMTTLFAEIIKFVMQLNQNDRKIIKMLKLDRLFSTDFWADLINTANRGEANASATAVIKSSMYTQNFIPRLVVLISQSSDKIIGNALQNDTVKANQVLRVLLPEDANSLSSPKRIVDAINSVNDIYVATCKINDLADNNLAVLSCDSGSDKAFDFIGLSRAMEVIKEIILSVWDRVIYYREHKFSTRLDLIMKALPIMEQVQEMEAAGKLPREQSHIIMDKLTKGIRGFLESGCIIPEMNSATDFQPKVLLEAKPELLLSAPIITPPDSDGTESRGEITDEGLNDVERSEIEEALRLIRSRKAGPKSGSDAAPDLES